MNVINIRNISKSFLIRKAKEKTLKGNIISFIKGKKEDIEKFWALKNINIEINKGEFVGIIGANGSGKSTLLKLFSGIIYPDSGQVEIAGKMSSLLELGSGFHPELSGLENIYLNGSILGLKKKEIDNKLNEIIEFSELKNFINNPVKTYSSGMYIRLGFSIAVCVNPDILLVDEVFAVGDEHFVHKCYERIENFKKQKKTIIIVTHDLGAVEKWCDRAIWIHKGEKLEDGQPRYVIDKYREKIMGIETNEKKASQEISVGEIKSDTSEKMRWGDKSVEIINVKLLNNKNTEQYIFDVEDMMKIEFDYKINLINDNLKNKDIVFGIGIFRADGICCYGSNTDIEKVNIKELKKTGRIQVELEKAGLLSGEYSMDIAIHSISGLPYDYWRGAIKFGIRSNLQDVGVYRPKHKWNIILN